MNQLQDLRRSIKFIALFPFRPSPFTLQLCVNVLLDGQSLCCSLQDDDGAEEEDDDQLVSLSFFLLRSINEFIMNGHAQWDVKEEIIAQQGSLCPVYKLFPLERHLANGGASLCGSCCCF